MNDVRWSEGALGEGYYLTIGGKYAGRAMEYRNVNGEPEGYRLYAAPKLRQANLDEEWFTTPEDVNNFLTSSDDTLQGLE